MFSMNRIKNKFFELKEKNKNALITFITANDPNYQISNKLLQRLPSFGADIIEIGLPFSDPMADGPVIQKSSLRAIKSKFSLEKTFKSIRSFRNINNKTPIILMGYFNTFFQFGLKKFFVYSKKYGVDGLIIVDLPPEEYELINALQKQYKIDIIRLITPTTNEKRLKIILKNATGFLYYVSILGITGTKIPSLQKVKKHIAMIKKKTDLPIAIGFGIKKKSQVNEISKFAEGSVVGSSIVRIVEEYSKNLKNDEIMLKEIKLFLKTLRSD